MIEIEKDSYLVDFSKKEEFFIGSRFLGNAIIALELYYLEGKKYLKITTCPVHYVI